MPRSIAEAPLPALLAQRRRTLARLRRWAYFERRDDGWQAMIPYRSLPAYEAIIRAENDGTRREAIDRLREQVIEAISISEGLRDPQLRRAYLGLRTSRPKNASVKSYRLFPKGLFAVQIPQGGHLTEFLEYAPDAIDLVATKGTARLRLTLDLLEMLELIRCGYRPSPTDLQGLFVNLSIFRNELLNLPFDRVVLTTDDQALYELTASVGGESGIQLEIRRHTSSTPEVRA